MTSNADQVAYWNEVAGPKWVTNQARLDRFMAPLTAFLVDAIATRPGESALDVGCGCGDLALTLAARVGAAGRVLGVDVSEPMLAQARARTVEANLRRGSIGLRLTPWFTRSRRSSTCSPRASA